MKKITFILFALIAGTTFAQNTANATATVNAEIVETIGITSADALNFGKFTKSATAATVIINALGTTRVFSQTDMKIVAFPGFGVPTFTVTKDATASYGITLGVNTMPTSGTNSMVLDNLTHSLPTNGGNTAADFTVGGTLNVPSTQATGIYTGEVSVTVTYE